MERQRLIEAYTFFQEALNDYTKAKIQKNEKIVVNRIQNYMMGKNELSDLLYNNDVAFCSFKGKYVESDLLSALRTLQRLSTK